MEAKMTAAAAFVLLYAKRQKRKRKMWVRNWIARRPQMGASSTLVRELEIEDAQQFRTFFRMTAVELQQLIEYVGPNVAKKNTKMRDAISARDRVIITISFLASGASYSYMQHLFRVPSCTIGRIVLQVTTAMYDCMKEQYLKFPESSQEWEAHAQAFEKKWNFPHCLGALDGKHVVMQAPAHSGSHYYNYKGTHSIVLLAVVDANYKFIYVDVGCNGRISDGGVFQNSSLGQKLEDGSIQLPTPVALPDRTMAVPYCFVADDAFAMKPYILKPYPFKNQPAPQRIFNYRLSRARRIVENAFGIISNKFRVLRTSINLHPDRVKKIVLAICVLHNFLISQNDSSSNYLVARLLDSENESHELLQGMWRDDPVSQNAFLDLEQGRLHNYSNQQKEVRNEFANYFMSPMGEIKWQYKYV